MKSLNELEPEDRATICQVNGHGALRKRLLDMGIVPGTEIEVVRIAPLGDPVEYLVKGYRLSLRRSEAAHVLVMGSPCCDCPDRDSCPHRRGRRRGRRRGWRRRWLSWLNNEASLPAEKDLQQEGQVADHERP